jgi:hypothetical protein
MMEFEEVTPFRLVRSLGVSGTRNPAIYLLICDGPSVLEIEQDLSTETEVQLGTVIRISTASEVLRDGLPAWDDGSTRLIYFDRWLPKLVAAMDRHSALLVQDGGQLLMLADKKFAERLLGGAPNLRSRLADVFQIIPDKSLGARPA